MKIVGGTKETILAGEIIKIHKILCKAVAKLLSYKSNDAIPYSDKVMISYHTLTK